ncbi:hypothetical protein WJ36_09705 [Burkholderia ubonensis]|nr:hypothetical protein WJ36_09705 [Burkholderia ubonensis]
MKSKRTSDGRKLDYATLQAMRQQAVQAIRKGQAVTGVAAAYGVNGRSVYRWLADLPMAAQNALFAKSIPGRTSKVSAEEMQWLVQAVRDHSLLQFKFEFQSMLAFKRRSDGYCQRAGSPVWSKR